MLITSYHSIKRIFIIKILTKLAFKIIVMLFYRFRYLIEEMKAQPNEIILIGFSMGTAVAIHLASHEKVPSTFHTIIL